MILPGTDGEPNRNEDLCNLVVDFGIIDQAELNARESLNNE
jgi:hypothetical protein